MAFGQGTILLRGDAPRGLRTGLRRRPRRAAGVGGRVVVTGRVGEADLQALHAGARAVAVPSRPEGFGLPVVKTMAHGIPVVTSDDPALVEVGGGVAASVPACDAPALAAALTEEAADGPPWAWRVEEGTPRAAEFSWAGTAAARCGRSTGQSPERSVS